MSAIKVILNGEVQDNLVLGFSAWVVGTGAAETLTLGAGYDFVFSAGNSDRVNLPGSIDDYTISMSGNQIQFESLDGSVVTLAVGGVAMVGFDEGLAQLSMNFGAQGPQINLGDATILDGETLADSGSVFGDMAPAVVSIDTGTLMDPVVFDAGSGAFDFTDDGTVLNSVVINNFSSDDRILINNALESDYTFANDGADVRITYNNQGTINEVLLTGVVTADVLVYDQASFEAQLGFDAFTS